MSRALDKTTVAALEKGDALAAFKAISEALNPRATEELLEIEVLPRGHHLGPGIYLLRDGPAIAVSKLGLVQAFLVAREILKGHIQKAASKADESLLAATAVILLMDPEHITAANARKRLLQSYRSDAGEIRERIQEERRFLDSLLVSRLHRHTKSPTLWNHRRWLVELSIELGMPAGGLGDMINIIMVAAERHPRNYYAWSHARYLMALPTTASQEIDSIVVPAVKDWCLRHHTDISGWTFLIFLLDLRSPAASALSSSTFADILRITTSLRWMNESVWVFLRTVAASGLVGEAEYAEFIRARDTLLGVAKDAAQTAVLRAALEWTETYRLKT